MRLNSFMMTFFDLTINFDCDQDEGKCQSMLPLFHEHGHLSTEFSVRPSHKICQAIPSHIVRGSRSKANVNWINAVHLVLCFPPPLLWFFQLSGNMHYDVWLKLKVHSTVIRISAFPNFHVPTFTSFIHYWKRKSSTRLGGKTKTSQNNSMMR